jgi:hypothetical protein
MQHKNIAKKQIINYYQQGADVAFSDVVCSFLVVKK